MFKMSLFPREWFEMKEKQADNGVTVRHYVIIYNHKSINLWTALRERENRRCSKIPVCSIKILILVPGGYCYYFSRLPD